MNQKTQNKTLHGHWLNKSVCVVLILLLGGCGGPGKSVSVDPAGSEQWRWVDEQQHYYLLAGMALELEATELPHRIPSDIQAYCEGYPQLSVTQRQRFWSDLLSAISFYESGHDPELTYRERFRDRVGARVISRGLLQLSFESSKGYDCPLERARQLHDPAKNIDCAVRILNKWVLEDNVISDKVGWLGSQWRGAARYWSVLRRPAKRAAIQAQLQQQAYCRV